MTNSGIFLNWVVWGACQSDRENDRRNRFRPVMPTWVLCGRLLALWIFTFITWISLLSYYSSSLYDEKRQVYFKLGGTLLMVWIIQSLWMAVNILLLIFCAAFSAGSH
jgi:hypothetical protein